MPARSLSLPAGQRAVAGFPRFGLPRSATRWPPAAPGTLRVVGDVRHPLELPPVELAALPHRERTTAWRAGLAGAPT